MAAVGIEPSNFAFSVSSDSSSIASPPGYMRDIPRNTSFHRAALHGVLLEAVRERLGPEAVRTGHRCVGLTQDDNAAEVSFADPDGKLKPRAATW